MHLGLVLLCAAAFLRYTIWRQVVGSSLKPSHGTLMFILYSIIMPVLVFGDSVAAVVGAFK